MSAQKQQWLVFSAEQHSFAIHTDEIVEIVPVERNTLTSLSAPGVIGWIDVQSQKVPILDLVAQIFHKTPEYGHHEIIVIRGKEQLIGLMAERVLAVTQLGCEQGLNHCVEQGLLDSIHYLKPEHLAVMRHS